MEFSFLEVLAKQYINEQLPFAKPSETESEENKEFYAKYIEPMFEKNKDFGEEIEADYGAAICAEKHQSFKDGFKACMQMMLECTSKKAVKS